MRARLVLLSLVAACHGGHGEPVKTPPAGVSSAMYGSGGGGSFGVVDDRRYVDVKDKQLWLDDIDPGAALPSLVIEALSGAPLELGACERDRMPAGPKAKPVVAPVENMPVLPPSRYRGRRRPPLPQPPPMQSPSDANLPPVAMPGGGFAPDVHCAITGEPGRRLVRVLYVSTTLSYRGQHDISMTEPGKAHLSTRFAIVTPQWRARDGAPVRADITLYDGVPGGDQAPVEIATGRIAIDGSTAVVTPPPRDVAARLRRIYDGAIESDPSTAISEPEWNLQSHEQVWTWLELPGVKLAPGEVLVHVMLPDEGTHDVVVPSGGRVVDTAGSGTGSGSGSSVDSLRLPLWIDPELHGQRTRVPIGGGGGRLTERAMLSISNMGDQPREVWFEEKMRTAHKRVVTHAWPDKVQLHGDLLRVKATVKPGDIAREAFTIDYSFNAN